MAEKKDTIKKQIELLKSGSKEEQLKVLKKVKNSGSSELIKPMIELFNNSDSKIADQILDILAQLKDTKSGDEVLSGLLSTEDYEKKAQILNSMWNSSLDYSEKVAPVIKNGLENDFMVAFEIVTIVENLKGPFVEEDLLDASLHLSSVKIEDYDESVQPFLVQLQGFVNQYLQTV